MLKLTKQRLNEHWTGSKEVQEGGERDGKALSQPDGFPVLGGR